jgi:hypothetical protein
MIPALSTSPLCDVDDCPRPVSGSSAPYCDRHGRFAPRFEEPRETRPARPAEHAAAVLVLDVPRQRTAEPVAVA